MKMVKSLLLGTAAGLVAMTGAQAADLPVKAKPVQYVKICSLYGAGFYYMPGTDTCIKVGGFVRTEMNFNAGGSFSVYHSQNLDDPAKVFNLWRTRAYITADARSQTEYGTLRAYIAGGYQWDNGAGSGAAVHAIRGFIQWAGFTAGRAQSFFDFYNTPAYSNTTNVWGSDSGGNGLNVLGYTAQFGNGFSATISVEDSVHRRDNPGGGIANGTNTIFGSAYAGNTWPDLVANLRIDQSWGSAQVMGALHRVAAIAPGFETQDEIGWAIGGGLTINLPMLGRGDSLSAQVTYAEGALNYVGSGLGAVAAPGFNMWAICSGVTCAFGPVGDATVLASGDLSLTTGWSVVAGFQHSWNPKWKTSLYGTYGEINYDAAANAAAFGADGSWKMWQIGTRTIWTPVTNLDLSVDIMYNHLDTAFTGAGFVVNPNGILVSGTPDDKGWWQGMIRAQRNFYP